VLLYWRCCWDLGFRDCVCVVGRSLISTRRLEKLAIQAWRILVLADLWNFCRRTFIRVNTFSTTASTSLAWLFAIAFQFATSALSESGLLVFLWWCTKLQKSRRAATSKQDTGKRRRFCPLGVGFDGELSCFGITSQASKELGVVDCRCSCFGGGCCAGAGGGGGGGGGDGPAAASLGLWIWSSPDIFGICSAVLWWVGCVGTLLTRPKFRESNKDTFGPVSEITLFNFAGPGIIPPGGVKDPDLRGLGSRNPR
jgi:hypothetical protein